MGRYELVIVLVPRFEVMWYCNNLSHISYRALTNRNYFILMQHFTPPPLFLHHSLTTYRVFFDFIFFYVSYDVYN